jgi:[ribosomal protein S18]-alanine N-acetyltransferase
MRGRQWCRAMTSGADKMVSAVCIADLGAEALADVDEIMRSAFDPLYGEAWTKGQCLGIIGMPGYRLRGAWVDHQSVEQSIAAGAVDDRLLAGFSITRSVMDESELLLLAVATFARRSGVGSALMQHWIDEAHAFGVRRLFLEMREDNSARLLYERFGFADVAVRKGYYRGSDGQHRDAITQQRLLP